MPLRDAINTFFRRQWRFFHYPIYLPRLRGTLGSHFEFYIYTLVIDGLSVNYNIIPHQSACHEFVFNCGPSGFPSNDRFIIENRNTPDRRFDVITGTSFIGSSTLMHQLDITVIQVDSDKSKDPYEANGRSDYPHTRDIRLVIECKDYPVINRLLSEIRGFVGVVNDLEESTTYQFARVGHHQIKELRTSFRRTDSVFVSRWPLGERIDFTAYLSSQGVELCGNLTPKVDPNNHLLIPTDEEREFIKYIADISRHW